MEAKFSNRVKEVISLAREEAIRLGHDYIGTEHLVLGMIREGEGIALELIKKCGVNLEDLRITIEKATQGVARSNYTIKNKQDIPLSRQAEKVLRVTYLEARIFKTNLVGTEHLLMAILRDEDNLARQILEKFQINYDMIKDMVEYQSNPNIKSDRLIQMITMMTQDLLRVARAWVVVQRLIKEQRNLKLQYWTISVVTLPKLLKQEN
jgi:ATP-dependent Clp protease ATP-binding subunit ClpC